MPKKPSRMALRAVRRRVKEDLTAHGSRHGPILIHSRNERIQNEALTQPQAAFKP